MTQHDFVSLEGGAGAVRPRRDAPRDMATPRGLLWLATALYTAFVLYGSLVPLEFRAIPWDEAAARFAAMPFLELGIGSRADWAANLLLFIPLAFLWMAALSAGHSRLRTVVLALLLVPAATALSLGIEYLQLFFPQRTVSQNDVFAETLGGVIGVLLWLGAGRRFLEWLQAWQQVHTRAALAERLAWGYLAGVMVYNVLPLDLTISPVEIFHKWQEGRVNLVPFAKLPTDRAEALYELATDVLIWAPLALLWRLDGTHSALRAGAMALAAAALLEALQLFVYSRVSDVTDLLTAAAGAALGASIGGRLVRRPPPMSSAAMRPWGRSLPFALAAAWMALLLFVFWFPFDFRTDAAYLRSRLDFLQRAPFEVYYFGTEYRAVTEVLRKTLFFAPLGGLLAWGVANQPWRWRDPLAAASMLVLVGAPAVIELGQLALPAKLPDMTDWLLAWLGGVAGYGVARRMLRAPRRAAPAATARTGKGAEEGTAAPAVHRVHWNLPLTLGGMSLLFWGAGRASFVPYNVRELFGHDAAWVSALLLALVCVWLAVWPVWLARRRLSGVARVALLPVGLVVYGGGAFLLLRVAVPAESLHDIVGSPVLAWPGQWELALRWMALAAVPGVLLYLAAQTVNRQRGGALNVGVAVLVLGLGYWGVVVQAATDNLTELIATPRLQAFAALCVWLYLTFLAAALLASPALAGQRAMRLAGALALLPLAALFLHLGLADEIDKYGQRFSALQFLLSRDRQHYAAGPVVWLRYGALHVVVVAALAFIQWPHFRTEQARSHGDH